MWHNRSIEELMIELGGNYDGLSGKQALDKLGKEGYNEIEEARKKPLWLRMLLQLRDPMIIVLLIAGGLSYLASGGEDWLDAAIILLIVFVNNMIAISQEDHAYKALEALKNMSSSTATVWREGREMEIDPRSLVTGDIMILRTGDKVPADGRLIQAVSLQTDESAMTGESLPVEKRLIHTLPKIAPVGDWTNMVLSGTLVTGGHGKALIVATGMNTQMGKIANLLQKQGTQMSPLQEKMAEVSKTLSFLCVSICGVMFGIGLIQGQDMLSMFMTAVALAVAAIPEGLPAVVSIVLTLGMSRMAERGAIVKKLPAVETLGCASVICSDKTGTLTQNKMTVQEAYTIPGTDGKLALQCAMLCSNAVVQVQEGNFVVRGSPTESALALYAAKHGINRDELWKSFPKIEEIPFDSERKLMSTIHPNPEGGYIVYVKGAPDVLLKLCTQSLHGQMSGKYRQEIMEQNENMARRAMRVIAVAQRNIAFLPTKLSGEWLEQGLTFLGLFGISDPPRPEVKEAVARCHKAGVRPVMITGDHRSTAIAIAKELDIYREGDWAVTGQELDFMPQAVLEHDIERFTVFARVSPEHKMRIVQAWQNKGKVVAVTGDGVNDAPALKAADIGCAMGLAGTDVAKGAAEMILTTDNFHTIVHAIEEGRGIYANIKKAIHYLLSCNIGEIITIFVGTMLHLTTMPLVPVQLLWLNLVTDTLPALALGVESVEEGMMEKKPRGREQSFFDKTFSNRLIWQGVMVGLLTLAAYGLGYFYLSPAEFTDLERGAVANTMAFATLTLSQLFHAFNVRSETKSIFQIGVFSNTAMNQAFVLGMLLQVAVLTIAPLQAVFSVITMNPHQWTGVFILAMMPIPICETVKLVQRMKKVKGKRVVSSREFRKQKEEESVRMAQEQEYHEASMQQSIEEKKRWQKKKDKKIKELAEEFSSEMEQLDGRLGLDDQNSLLQDHEGSDLDVLSTLQVDRPVVKSKISEDMGIKVPEIKEQFPIEWFETKEIEKMDTPREKEKKTVGKIHDFSEYLEREREKSRQQEEGQEELQKLQELQEQKVKALSLRMGEKEPYGLMPLSLDTRVQYTEEQLEQSMDPPVKKAGKKGKGKGKKKKRKSRDSAVF